MKFMRWFIFISTMAVLAMVPILLAMVVVTFLKIAVILTGLGLIILLVVLQILGKITLQKMLWWIASIIAVMIITFIIPWTQIWLATQSGSHQITTPAATGIQIVKPAEMWMCEWSTSLRESRTFEAKIDKLDSESLWFNTPYSCGGQTRIASYMLSRSGDNFTGSWTQNCPKDSGTLYLKKDGDCRYTGQITDETGKIAIIILKRK